MSENEDKDIYLLPEKESLKIFNGYIVPYLFSDAQPSENKRVIFVGAQPGAGKTALLGHLVHKEPNDHVVQIVGDDLRAFHPQYDSLLKEDDKSAAFFTDHDTARWIEMSIKHAAEKVACSVGIEGTLRRHEVVNETSSFFRQHGYHSQLNILLTHSLLSRLGIIERYLAQHKNTGTGRFTLREAHDVAYNRLPNTVDQLLQDRAIDEVCLYGRGGTELGQWTFNNEEEKLRNRDEVMNMVKQSREHISPAEIDYLNTALPEVAGDIQKTGKLHLLTEFESIQQEFLEMSKTLVT